MSRVRGPPGRRSARSAGRTASRARDPRRAGPGSARPAGGPARAAGARRRPGAAARGRASASRARARAPPATASPADSGRAAISRVAGSRPRVCISSVKLRAPGEVDVDPRREDERAAAAGPLEPPFADELAQRPPDRDEAAAVALGEVALGRQPVAGRHSPRVEGGLQVEIDLVVERDRAELESETGHRAGRTSGEESGGLRGLARAAIADNVISNRVKPRGDDA